MSKKNVIFVILLLCTPDCQILIKSCQNFFWSFWIFYDHKIHNLQNIVMKFPKRVNAKTTTFQLTCYITKQNLLSHRLTPPPLLTPRNKILEDTHKSIAKVNGKLYFALNIMEVHLETQGKVMYSIALFSSKLRNSMSGVQLGNR